MNEAEFKLFGFASGGGSAPQFLEPIFINNKYALFVQSCMDRHDPDVITGFIRFIDDVEVLENSSEEILKLGALRLFAIRDVGDRVICGDREYVEKYLKLNLNSYIDRPYFYKNACKFLKYERPELKLFSSNSDTLESSVFSHSIKRFCDFEYKDKLSSTPRKNLVSNEYEEYKLYFDIFEKKEDKSIFSRWLDFAEDDSPKLAKHSRWKFISKNYGSIFDDDCQEPDNACVFFLTAKNIINDEEIDIKLSEIIRNSKDKDTLINNIEELTKNMLSDICGINTSSFGDSQIESFSIKTRGNRVNKFSQTIAANIYFSFSTEKVSKMEVTMLVYFLSLVSKRVNEIMLRKDEGY